MGRIQGKVAIITGAAKGFGKATALLFSKEGAKVVVADLEPEAGAKVVEEIIDLGGEAMFVKTDVSRSEEVKKLVQAAVDTYGRLDIMFNNAGIQGIHPGIAFLDEAVYDRFMAVNLKGVFLGIKYAAPVMVRQRSGSIINTASVAGMLGCLGGGAYGVSKAGVIQLTRVAANELGMYNVRCNAISPYSTENPDNLAIPESHLKITKEGNCMGRLIKLYNIPYAALYFASDESDCVTGVNLPIDAGATIRTQPFDMEVWARTNDFSALDW